MYEFNTAAAGYWRNWERNVGWLAREINFIAITGNPHIKATAKPNSRRDLFKLSTDEKEKKTNKKKPSIEELKKTHAKFFER